MPADAVDPRSRAGATKRQRTRAALLRAATELFETRGWAGTRMEAIAVAAGVSTATAYNHFPSKRAIVGAAYAPVLDPVTRLVEREARAGRPALEVLDLAVRGAAEAARTRTNLTAAFLTAVQEAAVLREGAPPQPTDPDDPRSYVQLPAAVAGAVAAAQGRGELRAFPPAPDIGTSMINLLLLRVINRREETAATTAEVVLTLLVGALKPEVLVAAGPTGRPFST